MTTEELNKKLRNIECEAKAKMHDVRKEYVEANKRFDVDDFVYNVTGIIKVRRVSYQFFLGQIQIRYVGKRYKKVKGVLSPTKAKYLGSLTDNDSLKKMDISNLIIE